MRDFIEGWDRAYPVPAPAPGTAPHFSEQVTHDVASVLVAHGFPPVSNDFDWGDLDLALWAFLYGTRNVA
ncbi:hypothetical protein Stsp01_40150 [Streptomyces sp. NBRC 13847]|uniref:hypothetical protein n=1 Tax=Streptomyces TaxID=1883 RepID=UPI00249FC815|nr:hypothetical protein [Streptomyces sp. NBRC 13847]GLW17272.1 hypothetical protein Stsp01_40150 [Streptomyces sp. NBRC 13847]